MMPSALENEPIIRQYEAEYVIAFSILSSQRPRGLGVSPISITDMASYLQLYPAIDTDLFIYLMCEMDDEYIKLKDK